MTPQEEDILDYRNSQQALADFSAWLDSLPEPEPYQPRCGDCQYFKSFYDQTYLATGYCTRNSSNHPQSQEISNHPESQETGNPLARYDFACPEFEPDDPF